MVRKVFKHQWDEGVVSDFLENTYYIIEANGRRLCRNSSSSLQVGPTMNAAALVEQLELQQRVL